MQNQVQALESRVKGRSPARDRWGKFATVVKDSLFITAIGLCAIALLASVWFALLWPLSNDAPAISAIFP
jgi:hypothetical protein